VPIAEETGLITDIGEWAIRQACADAVTWPSEVKLAVNISPAQLRRRKLAAIVLDALAASRLPPDRLEVEVTEAVMMEETPAVLSALHRLRDLGVTIVLDDFGTGYSSLSYLRKFPFDKVKIDKSFIQELPNAHNSSAIVRAITGLARALGMSTTAEGVETLQQRQIAKASGCSQMQGYLFSPPKPQKDLATILRSGAGR
jgi:EAL domain-containing protein (putative c-di-GMP-specific phosphodiesterase class I)